MAARRIVRFDCFEVDLAGGHLSKRGTRLRLPDQPFRVLSALLERPGEVVTREELRRLLWPEDVFVDFDNVLNTAVAKVRDALGESADRPRFVETLPKRGYRFIGVVSENPPVAERAAERRARLLVLPFMNASGDPAEEYFADAMTDEVITAIAAVASHDLAVIARTTAMHYKGTAKSVLGIARELNLDYIVEGGVRRDGLRSAFNVQLIRASDESHLWARRYDAEMGEIFAVQAAIAESILGQLGVPPPAGAHSARAARQPTADLAAHTLYRQGRYHLSHQTPEEVAKGKHYFEQAVARDPRFALAWDALADLCWWSGFYGRAAPRDVFGTGMSYALRALDIDNTLAETHALLGLFRKQLDYDWAEVSREMARARELGPDSLIVKRQYAVGWLLPQCRIADAIRELESGLEWDPLDISLRAWLGTMFWLDRQYDRAIEQARLMLDFRPENYTGYWLLGLFSREAGLFDEAIAAHHKALELSGGSMLMLGWLGLALGQAGKTSEARDALQRLGEAADRMYVPPSSFAWTHLALGDIDSAFLWMDRAVDACEEVIMAIQTLPFLDPLRDDPRYSELLRKLKMTPRPTPSR